MYNLILHTTTGCNFDCTYCDVIKDNQTISEDILYLVLEFIKDNHLNIDRFKFFGGEPLLTWKTIKYIIDNTNGLLTDKYEIVTNTTLLKPEIGEYFRDYFKIIYFSIDSENKFNLEKNLNFINKYNLEKKLYFNLIIDPSKILNSQEKFFDLYNNGMRGFNILPVYYTKSWNISQLKDFSTIMKRILDLSIKDKSLRLYGFTENTGENASLINNSLFIDTKGEIFFSDLPSTFLGQKIKNKLYLGRIGHFLLSNLPENFEKQKGFILNLEKQIYENVGGQKQLHIIMDYFSHYLNQKNAK